MITFGTIEIIILTIISIFILMGIIIFINLKKNKS